MVENLMIGLWGWDDTNKIWVKVLVNADGKLIIDPSEILENPPTNGETAKAPQSDWAYDHWKDPNAHVPASGGKAYYNGAGIYVARDEVMPVPLDTVVTGSDPQSEWDVGVTSSTATAGTSGTTLKDSSNPFVPSDVGKDVWNTQTGDAGLGKHTTIAAYVSASQVTLTADINLGSGDTYKFGNCRFVAAEDGVYICTFNVYFGGTINTAKRFDARILVNGSTYAMGRLHSGVAAIIIPFGADILYLEADDYVQLGIWHDDTNAVRLSGATYYGFINLRRVS